MSLIRAQQRVSAAAEDPDVLAAGRQLSWVSDSSSAIPMIALSGVRISWLMLARKSLFARLATSAASLASRSSAVRSATRCSSSTDVRRNRLMTSARPPSPTSPHRCHQDEGVAQSRVSLGNDSIQRPDDLQHAAHVADLPVGLGTRRVTVVTVRRSSRASCPPSHSAARGGPRPPRSGRMAGRDAPAGCATRPARRRLAARHPGAMETGSRCRAGPACRSPWRQSGGRAPC